MFILLHRVKLRNLTEDHHEFFAIFSLQIRFFILNSIQIHRFFQAIFHENLSNFCLNLTPEKPTVDLREETTVNVKKKPPSTPNDACVFSAPSCAQSSTSNRRDDERADDPRAREEQPTLRDAAAL